MSNIRNKDQALAALESTLIRQLLQASGAFAGNGATGAKERADMFIEVLADTVAKSGGLGVAKLIEDKLGDGKGQAHDKKGLHSLGHTNHHIGHFDVASMASPASAALSDDDDPRDAMILADPNADTPIEEPTAPTAVGKTSAFGEISSPFGVRKDPINGTTRYHTGIDFAVPTGTPILAAADGVVKAAGRRGDYGNVVEIDHGHGVSTLYAHNSQLTVTPGEKVAAGQEIAASGASGRATGPHLHFEVRKQNHPINPARALSAYGIRAEDSIEGTKVPEKAGGGK